LDLLFRLQLASVIPTTLEHALALHLPQASLARWRSQGCQLCEYLLSTDEDGSCLSRPIFDGKGEIAGKDVAVVNPQVCSPAPARSLACDSSTCFGVAPTADYESLDDLAMFKDPADNAS
jgi:hypothetical protein